MQYIEEKKRMFQIVRKIIQENKHRRRWIVFDIMNSTGFSKKAIDNYIDELIHLEVAEEDKGTILTWRQNEIHGKTNKPKTD